jgi:phosphatidylinositol alpha-1,6-mannosyltransferase
MIVHSFDYPPMHGGIARLCGEIAAGFLRRGRAVRVLSQAAALGPGSRIPDVPEARVTARRPWREWQALWRLRRGGPTSEPVICGTWYPEGLLAMLAGLRPFVVLAHGGELLPTPARWRRELWRRLRRSVLTSADLVVANSGYTPSSRVAAIPLAADHHRFAPGDRAEVRSRLGLADDRRVLSTVSRLHAYKGHDVAFRALGSLAAPVRERFVYLIAGRGPDRDLIQAEARRQGVDHLVRWLGFVAEEALPDIYRASDLFVLCTRETARQEVEGFGLALLEAQACGTPVVGTRSGGIPDAVVPGEGGWLIEPDDAPMLARILLALDNEPASFRDAGIAARRRVERESTWDRYVERFEATLLAEGLLS